MTFEGSVTVSFFENFAAYGGAISATNTNITMYGRLLFADNSADKGGGAIPITEQTMINCSGRSITFRNNTSQTGGAIYAISPTYSEVGFRTTVELRDTLFEGNAAKDEGGAVYVSDSTINMTGTIHFVQNSAKSGGAMAFSGSGSELLLTRPLTAYFDKKIQLLKVGA